MTYLAIATTTALLCLVIGLVYAAGVLEQQRALLGDIRRELIQIRWRLGQAAVDAETSEAQRITDMGAAYAGMHAEEWEDEA